MNVSGSKQSDTGVHFIFLKFHSVFIFIFSFLISGYMHACITLIARLSLGNHTLFVSALCTLLPRDHLMFVLKI